MRVETGQRPSGLENCNPFAPPPIFCMMEGQRPCSDTIVPYNYDSRVITLKQEYGTESFPFQSFKYLIDRVMLI